MFEYTLENIHTKEYGYTFGWSFKNAMERCHLNPDDWRVVFCDYND